MEIQNKELAPEINTDILEKSMEYVLREAGKGKIKNYTIRIKPESCPMGLSNCCYNEQHTNCPNRPEYFPETRTIALTKGRSDIGYVLEFVHEFWHHCVGDKERMDFNDPREVKAREVTEKIYKNFI